MIHFEAARTIRTRLVPGSGQAETVQGELLRAVETCRDEAVRDGNADWDRDFEVLPAHLGSRLPDAAVFPPAVPARTAAVLARLRDRRDPVPDDEPYDEPGDRIVEHHRQHGSRPRTADPGLRR